MRFENSRSALASPLTAAVAAALVMITAACAPATPATPAFGSPSGQRYIESLSVEHDGDQVSVEIDEGAPALLSGEYELVVSCQEKVPPSVPVQITVIPAPDGEAPVVIWDGSAECGETRVLEFDESEPNDYIMTVGTVRWPQLVLGKGKVTLTRVG